MQVNFQDSCDAVATEIKARASGQNGFVDPHNRGRYSLVSANGNMVTAKRVTGNGVFTDKITFAMQANGSGCTVYACSESQGTSANDSGANMCNMFNLFCNSGETNPAKGVACKPVQNDLQYTITNQQCGRFAFANNYVGHRCQDRNPTCLVSQNTYFTEFLTSNTEETYFAEFLTSLNTEQLNTEQNYFAEFLTSDSLEAPQKVLRPLDF